MKVNLFIPERRYAFTKNPFGVLPLFVPAHPETPAASCKYRHAHAKQEPSAHRFLKVGAVALIMFAVVLLCVLREIQHTRELYRMSRLVTAVEAERRQWQEKYRLTEGRNASLLTVIHAQSTQTRDVKAFPVTCMLTVRQP